MLNARIIVTYSYLPGEYEPYVAELELKLPAVPCKGDLVPVLRSSGAELLAERLYSRWGEYDYTDVTRTRTLKISHEESWELLQQKISGYIQEIKAVLADVFTVNTNNANTTPEPLETVFDIETL